MIYKEEMANEDDPLLKTTVTNYLSNFIKDAKGNNLFEIVYPPIKGTREVMVKSDNLLTAIDFIQVCHGDLARNMDDEAIHKVFDDPIKVLTSINTTVWSPKSKTLTQK
jgi:hypothetical protein